MTNQKIKAVAVAVAGALAAPVTAFAQSSLTIGGHVIMSVDNLKISQPAAGRGNTSEWRLNDESSRINFDVRHGLGGGNTALVHLETTPNPDTGAALPVGGTSFIGVSTAAAGRLAAGRFGYHFKAPYDGWQLSQSLKVHPSSIIDFAGGGKVPMLNATRTANALQWSSPNWGGFTVDVGYSFNSGGSGNSEADLTTGNTARKGRAWVVNPTFTAANWSIAYLRWDGKTDAPGTSGLVAAGDTRTTGTTGLGVRDDQRKDSLYGYYKLAGLKLGFLWDKSKLKNPLTGDEVGNRTAWTIPIRYTMGAHNLLAHYTKAGDDKASAVRDGAKMWTVGYAYEFSKTTAVSVSYSKLNNDPGAAYEGYTVAGGLGSMNAGTLPGEDQRFVTFGVRQGF
jgi:predicted porin